MESSILRAAPFLIGTIVYFGFFIGLVVYVIVTINKFLRLKREHNDLLREIINKMDKK